MRCTKKLCIQLAVDGTNYCPMHLKLKGGPRPGISNSRSAGGKLSESTVGKDSAPAESPGWVLANKRKQPLLLGQAKTLSTNSPAARKGRSEVATPAKGVAGVSSKSKSRG